MRTLKEILAVARVTVMGIRQRGGMSFSNALSIALVVLVLIGFMAMADGFRSTLAKGGSDRIALVMSDGAQSEMTSAIDTATVNAALSAPGVARQAGQMAVSAETQAIVSITDQKSGEPVNVSLRGIGTQGLLVRPSLKLAEGRAIQPGTNEIMVGNEVARRSPAFAIGRKVKLGPVEWTVVGRFTSAGSAAESEVLADARLLSSVFPNQPPVQVLRILTDGPNGVAALSEHIARAPGPKAVVRTEREAYAAQAKGTSKLIKFVGWPLAIVMSLGALAGAVNTMYASVASRRQEIATLRILGYGGLPIFLGTVVESLVVALFGCALGLGLGWLFIDNIEASTVGANFTMVAFSFAMTWSTVIAAVILASVIGVIGSSMPAFSAVRQPLLDALAEE